MVLVVTSTTRCDHEVELLEPTTGIVCVRSETDRKQVSVMSEYIDTEWVDCAVCGAFYCRWKQNAFLLQPHPIWNSAVPGMAIIVPIAGEYPVVQVRDEDSREEWLFKITDEFLDGDRNYEIMLP